jgi:hypothetical protein
MHDILDHWYKLWAWLLANNGSRVAAILVVITGWYTVLTWRMARAISRQTRALVQPVALLTFHWGVMCYPKGHVEIKNLGTQPLLLLDIKLFCHRGDGLGRFRHFLEHYELWDQHIIPPGESLSPKFDFLSKFEKAKLQWDTNQLSYGLYVVTSDLSKQVVLTYSNIPVLGVANVRTGMPLAVRWRYFVGPVKRRYRRLLYRFRQPTIG